jgi:hypothetical protein
LYLGQLSLEGGALHAERGHAQRLRYGAATGDRLLAQECPHWPPRDPHRQVRDQHVQLRGAHQLDRLAPAGSLPHHAHVNVDRQKVAQPSAHDGMVVNDPYFDHHISCFSMGPARHCSAAGIDVVLALDLG